MVHLVFNAADHTPQGYITLTFGRSRTESRWVNQQSFSFPELASRLSNATVGEKDGPCYTPASFSGTLRRMDQATRIAAYTTMMQQERQDLPIIYLYSPVNIVGMQAKISGFQPVPNGMIRLQGLSVGR